MTTDAGGRPNGHSHRRRLTSLGVEDEVLVRAATAYQLRSIGYTVVEAGDASHALEVLQSQMQIDLVFTDIMMPGLLDGFDLARVVLSEYPKTKMVATSGVPHSAAHFKSLPMLRKPYTLQELERVIEQLIGKPDLD